MGRPWLVAAVGWVVTGRGWPVTTPSEFVWATKVLETTCEYQSMGGVSEDDRLAL